MDSPALASVLRLLRTHRRATVSLLAMLGLVLFFALRHDRPPAGTLRNSGRNVSLPPAPGSGSDAETAAVPDPFTATTSPAELVKKQSFTASPHYPAALAIAGMEENSTRAEALEALMETWAAANPEQAADWAGTLPAGIFRDDALSALMFHWAGPDPAAAAAWMTRTGVDDPEAASVLAGRWGKTDPAAAALWAGSLANPESRRDATSAIAGTWAGTSPAAAGAWAATLSPNERAAAITTVLAAWAGTDPAAAAAWLTKVKFPSPDEQSAALAALITPWSAQSPAAASKFINALPEGPAREAAASQFAVTAAATAPAEALMWAMNLRDPVQRNQVVADTCETWFDESPDTFRSGIAEALALMDDATMRRSVYEMLYERDPAFQAKLLKLADQPAAPPAPVPDQTPAR